MTRQDLCRKILTIVRQRLSETLGCSVDDIPELSLGRATNLLFLLCGQNLSIGEYGGTMASAFTLVGDLLWKLPSEFEAEEKKSEEKVVAIN